MNHSIPADGNLGKFQPKMVDQGLEQSAALSMANTKKDSIKSRKIAILAANGVDGAAIQQMKKALMVEGATAEIIAPKLGEITDAKGASIKVDKNLMTVSSVVYDAVYVPGGPDSVEALTNEADAVYFVNQAYKHCKAIAAGEGTKNFFSQTYLGNIADKKNELPGVVFSAGKNDSLTKQFVKNIAQHRFWEREAMPQVPA